MNAIKPLAPARRSARLAAKPRHNYAHAEAQLDAAVEEYVDPVGYEIIKRRVASFKKSREARIAWLTLEKIRKAMAQDIANIAVEIINIRSKCLSFNKCHMWHLEYEAKKLVAEARPTWTPENLQWAYTYVTDRQTSKSS